MLMKRNDTGENNALLVQVYAHHASNVGTRVSCMQHMLDKGCMLLTLFAWSHQRPAVLHACLLQVSPRGKVLQSFHDPSGTISMVTAVTEYNGKLYTGHLSRDYITVLDLKDVPSLQ